MSKRSAGNRGKFYPNHCNEIQEMIQDWNKIIDTTFKDKEALKAHPRAIISPHAGFMYSGFTANIAHRVLANSKAKRILVFGPSHHVPIEGISASEYTHYETPCGDIPIDVEYLKYIKKHFSLTFVPGAHKIEHSTETQMPFIKQYHPDVKIIEFIYGRVGYRFIAKMIVELLNDSDNLVVISTDLSHFYTLEQANKIDSICIEGVAKEDTDISNKGCEACGIIGMTAMIQAAKVLNLSTALLDYRTSADASGDKNRVVGYMSAVVK